MTIVGLLSVNYLLPPATQAMIENGIIADPAAYEYNVDEAHGSPSAGHH